MRRFLAVLLVVAFVITGCQSKDAVAKLAAARTVSEGDRLVAAKSHDKAIDVYLTAAAKMPAGELRETALRKASSALIDKVAEKPLPEQVDAVKGFLGRIPGGLLPLTVHNWLSYRLTSSAETVLDDGRTVWLAGARALPVETASASAEKPRSSRSSRKRRSSEESETPRLVPASNVATAPAVETPRTCPTPLQLRLVAKAAPGLGQPPAMRQLYLALATLSTERDRADKARVALLRYGPSRSRLNALRDAEKSLVHALSYTETLLAGM
jgi:hypothetical protein